MYALGLNHGEINTSAVLLKDGHPVAGAPEERFNRQKFTRAFPHNALDYCLESAGITLSDCTFIAQGWNPGLGWQKFNPMVSGQRRGREEYFYSVPDNLFTHLPAREPGDWVCMFWPKHTRIPPVYHVRHHACHAANAFFLSPFEDAAIMTCDFRGEFECATWGRGSGTQIETLQRQTIPHSLGMFYATFTELLGYRPDNDEWKVMALSAFDVPHQDLVDKLRNTYRVDAEGRLELDQAFYKGAIVDQPNLYTRNLVELMGGRIGKRGEEVDEWHLRVANAMQVCAEEIALAFLHQLHAMTRLPRLAVSGGFFMNSVLNGKILDHTPFREIFISYAPTDVGNSLGAALAIAHQEHGIARDIGFKTSCIGPAPADDAINEALRRRGIPGRRVAEPAVALAAILAKGEIVAVCHGQMEFGDRALGNRSILADPRPAGIKDKINAAIKYREAYRPFAPAVPEDRVEEFFDVPPGFTCRYMEKVVPIREAWRPRLGAVTHVDGSGRVQTVAPDVNPLFHQTLLEFEKLTGVPILLNTSFNVNAEPIVLSPDDALTTFFNSGLQYLLLGDVLVEKSKTVEI